MPARFQRTLQQADGLVFLRCGLAHRLADALPLAVLLLLKLPYRLVSFHAKRAALRQSPVTLRFGFLFFCDQCLCPFFRLFLYGFGKGFLHALVLGFQFGIFLFDRCGLADPDKAAEAVQYDRRIGL